MSAQLSLAFEAAPASRSAPMRRRESSEDCITRVLMDVLPGGVPPSFRRVVRSSFTGDRRVVATLEMFDGLPAEVEAWQWRPDGWAHRWLQLDGGDLSWEDGQWVRVQREAV